MAASRSYRIFSLGDSALTIEFGDRIDETVNQEVLSRFHALQSVPLPAMIEAIPSYCSLSIVYDLVKARQLPGNAGSAFERMKSEVEKWLEHTPPFADQENKIIRIPVCYDPAFGTDIGHVSREKKISVDEIVSIHTGKTYRVYMMGFLPGFAYMGELNNSLVMPRKSRPVLTLAGSVGIAGRQTGIYPLDSPGGWQVIGRTPVKLFDRDASQPVLFRAGDQVNFFSITTEEYNSLL